MLTKSNILFLWQQGLLDSTARYSDGREYDIVKCGMRIDSSDVDFTHACLVDRATRAQLWGSIRVDCKSSDWSTDSRINGGSGVILHVVFENDKQLLINDNPVLTCVVTPSQHFVDTLILAHKNCVHWFTTMDPSHREAIMERLVIDRLNRKADHFIAIARKTDWAEAAYIGFVGSMGYGNREMFEKIAASLPLHYIEHHFGREQIVEALMLGQAGLLTNVAEPDEYTQDLMQDFIKAKTANSLLTPPLVLTNNARAHSSPAISLVRAAHILCQTDTLLDYILQCDGIEATRELFNISLPSYWCNHIGPSHPTRIKGLDGLSDSKIDLLIINFVVPLIIGYGREHGLESYPHKAIDLLDGIKAEDNRYTRKFEALGYRCRSAYTSQALIELGSFYCDSATCADCPLAQWAIVN